MVADVAREPVHDSVGVEKTGGVGGGKGVVPVRLIAKIYGREIVLDEEKMCAQGAANKQRDDEAKEERLGGEDDDAQKAPT